MMKFLRLLRLARLPAMFALAAVAACVQAAAPSTVQTGQVSAALLAYAPGGVAQNSAGDGDINPVWVGLQIRHQPGWHTYWKSAGDSGLPTQLTWTLPPGVLAGDVQWPIPQKIRIGDLANYGYEGTVLLPVPLIVTPAYQPAPMTDTMEVGLKATWLVCRQECIPQDGEFTLQIPLRGSTALNAADFERALGEQQPAPLAGEQQVAISADGERVQLRISGLPESLQGRQLQLFPETPEILVAAARRSAQAGPSEWTQKWEGAVWTADYPVSPYRADGPERMPFVLTAGGRGWRADAAVQGVWPAPRPLAVNSPALAAALSGDVAARAPGGSGLPVGRMSLLAALLGALLGGLILNLMPCVFPVLAVKVVGFARHGDDRSAHRLDGLAYAAGVVASFLALGALMLGLRAAGEQLGWGFQLQSPMVVALLAALFTVIGLNLAGVFEFRNFAPGRLADYRARNPLVDSALSGLLVVAVASPCTAPFMGAALGLAVALPMPQALAVFAALGIGMALPYLALSWIPAIGRWLPRPGAWMDVFRKFMAFPMFGTAVWLVWVLGQQSGIDGAGALLALLVVLAFALWAFSLAGRSRWFTSGVAVLLAALLLPWLAPRVTAPMPPLAQTQVDAAGRWQPWSATRVDALLAEGKPVFVDFTAAWCVTCQYNKKTTLAKDEVLRAFDAAGVQTLEADWTRRDPAITAQIHALGRSGVPVYVLHAPGRSPVVLSELISVRDVLDALAQLKL